MIYNTDSHNSTKAFSYLGRILPNQNRLDTTNYTIKQVTNTSPNSKWEHQKTTNKRQQNHSLWTDSSLDYRGCIVVRCFMSILVLQSSWWRRESWLLCLICLPGVSWWLSGSSSQCRGVVCSLWLWYFLVILSYYFWGSLIEFYWLKLRPKQCRCLQIKLAKLIRRLTNLCITTESNLLVRECILHCLLTDCTFKI